jgi:hypothetical protein
MNVVDKLRLDGRFSINGGRFTDANVQQKINEMSLRATGKLAKAKEPAVAAPVVASDFQGRFKLADGVLRIPTLVFDIPGAAVKLQGTYALRPQTIAFSGNLYMDAKISQTVTGWKSMLLKIADPLFRENGQTVVPLKITGTRAAPRSAWTSAGSSKRANELPCAARATCERTWAGARSAARARARQESRGEALGKTRSRRGVRAARREPRAPGQAAATSFQNLREWSIRFRCISSWIST